MKNTVNQTVSTRNQSTVNFDSEKVFLGDNYFEEGVFTNETGSDVVLKAYSVVKRGANSKAVIPVAAAADIDNAVGILNLDSDLTVANNAIVNFNVCYSGRVNSGAIETGVALTTMQSGKSYADKLRDLGLQLLTVDNLFNYDN